MATTEKSIEVNVPISTAYNQWTQFETFPRFMENIEEVRQLDDRRLHWRAKLAGKEVEWDAEITEQIPDERVAWRSTSGARNAGVVTFHRLDENVTKVMLQLETEPEEMGLLEKVGDVLGLGTRSAENDLKRFKEFIESQGQETGGWRGEIERPKP